MKVAEAIDTATEWVTGYAQQDPGFRGAHLMGGVLSLPKSSPFPPTSDLDIGIVLEAPPIPGREVMDESFRGLMIEAGFRGGELYRSPEVVLSNPDLAFNLAADSIIADPYGLLADIHGRVGSEYGRRRWAAARCQDEKQRVLDALEAAAKAGTSTELLEAMIRTVLFLGGLIAVASLQQPTHRKSLVLLRELLRAQGRLDLYDDVLAVLGIEELTLDDVKAYLDWTTTAFDEAVGIWRTPIPLDFKLKSHLRPYVVESSRVMIEDGDFRESMLWILAALWVSTTAIRNDAPRAQSDKYERVWEKCFGDLRIAKPRLWANRLGLAVHTKDKLFELADQLVARLSDDIPTALAAT